MQLKTDLAEVVGPADQTWQTRRTYTLQAEAGEGKVLLSCGISCTPTQSSEKAAVGRSPGVPLNKRSSDRPVSESMPSNMEDIEAMV